MLCGSCLCESVARRRATPSHKHGIGIVWGAGCEHPSLCSGPRAPPRKCQRRGGGHAEQEGKLAEDIRPGHSEDSPDMENTKFKLTTRREDISMHSGYFQEQRIGIGNVHDIVDEGIHPPRATFLGEFGHLQEHKIREHGECVQHDSNIRELTFKDGKDKWRFQKVSLVPRRSGS